MASLLFALLIALLLDTGCCQIQKPVRLGQLIPDPLRGPDSVSGLVFLLNRDTVYFRNFSYNVDLTGFFCGGTTTSDLERFQWFDLPGFLSLGYSNSDIEFRIVTFPETEVGSLAWFGVCGYEFFTTDGSGSGDNDGVPSFREVILASVVIPPQVVPIVPCETTFLGELPTGSNGIAGRVYLLNRLTFAILGFSYDGQAEDAFFWVGDGDTPSISGSPCTYEGNIETRLPAFEDQDLVVQVPAVAVGTEVTYFSVWCRSNNINIGHVSVPTGLIPTPPPPPDDERVLLGPFNGHVHSVRGELFALDEHTLLLTNFHYDGTAPGAQFWAVRGETVFAPDAYIIPDEQGSTEPLGAYVDRTFTLTLPAGLTVHDFDWLSIWCVPFRQNFGEVKLPDNIILGGGIQIPTLPPIQCPAAVPAVPINCVQLSEEAQMSWVVDDISNVIVIELCGCVQLDDYIAFGISGSEHTTLMFGGDVTWTWMDNEGVHAGDLDLSAYAQCLIRHDQNGDLVQSGACPDIQNDVSDVAGYRDGCTTCVKYTRPLQSSDPHDRPYLLGQEQFVIWSMGPVGSLDTPLGTTIPVPFRHYAQADREVALRVNFSRSPLDECRLQCSDCEVPVVPWPRPVLEHTTTINARIGQSGSERGYAGITGTAGWGISWYLNGLLIPEVTVYRGTTYTFEVEGGSDPSVQARYHPFYITDSDRGGYIAKSVQEQQRETVFAGFDTDGITPLGVGRYCEYQNIDSDRSSEFTSFEEYLATLRLECDEGEGGTFRWTPDENTPDTVYFQCATHQFLGWTMRVEDPDPSTTPVPTVSPVNECETNNGGCAHICTDTDDSAQCSCRAGYVLSTDNMSCDEILTISISVDYTPPDDFVGGPNEYRAASGPVTVACTATGPETGAVSYQWSSTCRSCPFQSATSSSITRAAIHSGDTGTHTCVATRNGISASASIDFNVVDAGVHVFRGSPKGNFLNNDLVISDSPAGNDFRFRIFCRSDSMLENVGQFIGLDGTPLSSNSFFAIARHQPGEISMENTVGSQNALTVSQQGVYTCRIPLQSGEMREINVGVYPSGFNIPPTIVPSSATSDLVFTPGSAGSSSTLACTTANSPATTVTWTRDEQPLIIDGNTYQMIQTVTDRATSTFENVLTINQPLASVLGSTFSCTVVNAIGSAISNSLQVTETTTPPETEATTTPPETEATTTPPETEATTMPPDTVVTITPPDTEATTMPPDTEATTTPPDTEATTTPPETVATTTLPETEATTTLPETEATTTLPETEATTTLPETEATTTLPETEATTTLPETEATTTPPDTEATTTPPDTEATTTLPETEATTVLTVTMGTSTPPTTTSNPVTAETSVTPEIATGPGDDEDMPSVPDNENTSVPGGDDDDDFGPVGNESLNPDGLSGAVQESATVTLIVLVSSLIILGMFTL